MGSRPKPTAGFTPAVGCLNWLFAKALDLEDIFRVLENSHNRCPNFYTSHHISAVLTSHVFSTARQVQDQLGGPLDQGRRFRASEGGTSDPSFGQQEKPQGEKIEAGRRRGS